MNITMAARFRSAAAFMNDREYYVQLLHIGFPIALQQFIISSLNLIFVMLIGQKGEEMIAAVGLSGQIFFLFQLTLFGITSGSAMFTAQLWGKGDVINIRRVLLLGVIISIAISFIFIFIAVVIPSQVISLYTEDNQVISLASRFLRIFGWSYAMVAVSFMFASVQRSIGEVRVPLLISVSALGINTLLAYILIFGKFGFPALGIEGAALAGLISRILECTGMIASAYLLKSPVVFHLPDLRSLDFHFTQRILRPILPIAINEILWSIGITVYSVIYGRISTEALAAVNIAGTIDQIGIVVLIGIANACAILVGNLIGSGKQAQAYIYAGRSIILSMLSALVVGGLVIGLSSLLLQFYRVSPDVLVYTRNILILIGTFLFIRGANITLLIGVIRAGGDTVFGMLLEVGSIWLLGVPMAAIAAFIFNWPIHLVYLMVYSDELGKLTLSIWRYFSRRWIHDLASKV